MILAWASPFKYWLKIVVIKQSPLVCTIYNNFYMDVENWANGNNDNWVVLLRNLICQLGFADVLLAQGVGKIQLFLKLCQQRIRDQFIQQWFGEMATNTDTKLYSFIKTSFQYSDYLLHLNISKYRYSLLRFFGRNHKLPVVTGRWRRIPYQDRLCTTCNVLSDEYHLVFECVADNLVPLRKQSIPRYYTQRPSMIKFIKLLRSDNVTTIKKLSVFLYKALYM